MRISSRIFVGFVLAALFLPVAGADTLKITTTPPGATVVIDGIAAGITPYVKDYPGGYFHRTKTSFGSRLEHPMVARLILSGYVTREIQLTDGPMEWVSLNGRKQGEYWLFKSNQFEIQLEGLSQSFTGSISAALSSGALANLRPELSLERIVAQTKPAVVYLKGSTKAGTGFLVTGTGVIATNAHLARGEDSFVALFSSGSQLPAKVAYIDPDLDIAFLKVDGENLPHLTLADVSLIRQGENVVAVGNPGDAMLFSVTKGVVSAVGQFPSAGPGTWIQTDAPINPGNSGGPLLNFRGEVIGISTMKLVKQNVNGIAFALSAGDLLSILHRFYPDAVPVRPAAVPTAVASSAQAETIKTDAPIAPDEPASSQAPATPSATAPETPSGTGTVTISSDPDGAEIYIDGKFFGDAPATLKLSVGSHEVTLKFPGRTDWQRTLEILKSSKTTLNATLTRAHKAS
jgi:serine protease Do